MAFLLNRFELVGTLTRDPEMKSTQNGKNFCVLSIAQNEKDSSGNQKTTFLSAFVWGQAAEFACAYSHKGDTVYMEGKVGTKDETIGERRITSIVLTASRFQIVRSKATYNGGSAQPAPSGDTPASSPTSEPEIQLDISSDDLPF